MTLEHKNILAEMLMNDYAIRPSLAHLIVKVFIESAEQIIKEDSEIVEKSQKHYTHEFLKDCLSCANSFSEASDGKSDILHCMEKSGEVVLEDGYCEKYN